MLVLRRDAAGCVLTGNVWVRPFARTFGASVGLQKGDLSVVVGSSISEGGVADATAVVKLRF